MADYYKLLEDLIIKHGLEKYKEKIISISKPQLLVSSIEEDNFEQLGNTRFGGYPDLPKDIEYPKMINLHGNEKYLDFLCQLNLKDFAKYNLNLPKEGMLYFFSGQANLNNQDKASIIPYENSKIYYSTSSDLTSIDKIDRDLFLNNIRSEDVDNAYKIEVNLVPSIPFLDEFLHIHLLDKQNFSYENEYINFYNEWVNMEIFIYSLAEFYIEHNITYDTDIFYLYEVLEEQEENLLEKLYPLCTFFENGLSQTFIGGDIIVVSSKDIQTYNYFFSSL